MFRFISSLSLACLVFGSVVSDAHPQVSYPLFVSDSPSPTPGRYVASGSLGDVASVYTSFSYATPMLRRLSLNETFDTNSSNWIVIYDGGYKFNPDWYAAIFVPSGVFFLVILCLLYRQGCCYRRAARSPKDANGAANDVEIASVSANGSAKESWAQEPSQVDVSGVKKAGLAVRTYVNTRRLVTCA